MGFIILIVSGYGRDTYSGSPPRRLRARRSLPNHNSCTIVARPTDYQRTRCNCEIREFEARGNTVRSRSLLTPVPAVVVRVRGARSEIKVSPDLFNRSRPFRYHHRLPDACQQTVLAVRTVRTKRVVIFTTRPVLRVPLLNSARPHSKSTTVQTSPPCLLLPPSYHVCHFRTSCHSTRHPTAYPYTNHRHPDRNPRRRGQRKETSRYPPSATP